MRAREKPAKRPARGALPRTRISKPLSVRPMTTASATTAITAKSDAEMNGAADGRQQLPALEGDRSSES